MAKFLSKCMGKIKNNPRLILNLLVLIKKRVFAVFYILHLLMNSLQVVVAVVVVYYIILLLIFFSLKAKLVSFLFLFYFCCKFSI